MAKRKKKKTRADKEVEVREAKETVKLAEKETTVHKPTEAKPKPKAKPKVNAKDDTKPKPKPKSKSKSKAKAKPKAKSNIPSVIETPLAQIDEPVDILKEVDIGKPDSEILTENLEAPQTDDQTGDATEAVSEAVAEAVSPEGEVGSIQAVDEQTGSVVEAEGFDAESLSQGAVDTQTDKPVDVSESVVETLDTTESAKGKKADVQADKQAGDPTEVDVESSDTEILAENVEVPHTVDQTGNVTEAILEAAAETERLEEEAEGLDAESLSLKTEDVQTDKPVDDVPEPVVEDSVDAETPPEKIDDTQTDDQAGEVIEVATESESLTEEVEGLQTEDEQTDIIVESEDPDTVESLSQETEDTQTDKPTDDVSESVVEGSVDAENPTEKIDDTKTDDQAGEVIETATEVEELAEEAGSLQTEDEQTDIIVEAEDHDTAESSIQEAEDTQADKLTDDVSASVAEDSVDTETPPEKIEDTKTDDQADEVIEAEAEKLAEEVEGLQAEDEQAGVIVDAEDINTAESLSQEAEDTQTDELTDDVPEPVVEGSVGAENQTEKIDDTKTDDRPRDVIEDPDTIKSRVEKADDTLTDNQAGEAVEAAAEETVTEDAAESKTVVDRIKKVVSGESKTVVDRIKKVVSGESKTVVDRIKKVASGESKTVVGHIKKRLSGIFSIGSKPDDSTGEGIKSHAETESLTEGTEDINTDVREETAVGTVVEDPESVEDFTEGTDDTRTDKHKKAGIIISVFIVTAAVILLIVASIERRSAKSALVQVSKAAESIKQMQGEILKDREQIANSQIESKELVIDALSLTRNSLELEHANSDEFEVKRIIGIFINDIDERITKIKDNIALLRNELKETD